MHIKEIHVHVYYTTFFTIHVYNIEDSISCELKHDKKVNMNGLCNTELLKKNRARHKPGDAMHLKSTIMSKSWSCCRTWDICVLKTEALTEWQNIRFHEEVVKTKVHMYSVNW
jgi:hypothetical protein